MPEFIYVSLDHGVTADWNVVLISTGEVVVNNLHNISREEIISGRFAHMDWKPVDINLENE